MNVNVGLKSFCAVWACLWGTREGPKVEHVDKIETSADEKSPRKISNGHTLPCHISQQKQLLLRQI